MMMLVVFAGSIAVAIWVLAKCTELLVQQPAHTHTSANELHLVAIEYNVHQEIDEMRVRYNQASAFGSELLVLVEDRCESGLLV